MKVGIIGGGGRVGSTAAFALQCGGVVDEIVLADANAEAAAGEALDLLHGTSAAADQRIRAGHYDTLRDADIVVVAAGLRRQPDEPRLALINRNAALVAEILDNLKQAKLHDRAILLIVTNPVDVLTRLVVDRSNRNPDRILGLGTLLDSVRFASLIAAEAGVAPTAVRATVLGEHGDSMVPIWSSATIGGLPASQWPGLGPAVQNRIVERTKTAGAEVIRRKGGAAWAVALAVRDVVHAVALDRRTVLPVSTRQKGAFGITRTCLSVPTVIGRDGVVDRIELELWPRERSAVQTSAHLLDDAYAKVMVS